jgi:hypothetical protein
MDIADWLRSLRLERYETSFRENDVTAELLPSLTTDVRPRLKSHKFSPLEMSLRAK